MNENDRFNHNFDIAKVIFENMGYDIKGYNPNWTIENNFSNVVIQIDDMFMERLALGFGANWKPKFNLIEHYMKIYNDANDSIALNEHMCNFLENEDIPEFENKDDLKNELIIGMKETIDKKAKIINRSRKAIDFFKDYKGSFIIIMSYFKY
jgi:hypothetical protein